MKWHFVISVDTEEDIWGWRSEAPVTCTNVRQLLRLARFFRRFHVRPTFFVSYQVLSDPSARSIVAELGTEDGFEIGIHVHPWNTPPNDEYSRRTVLHNLPPQVQAAKIAATTRIYEEVFDRRPTSFRAGRFGLGADTAACLIEQGYCVDSSVTPFFDWTASSMGQNYVGAPLDVYRLSPESGVLKRDPRGRLVEVPLTSGYTRLRPDQWQAVAKFLDHGAVQAARVGGATARLLAFRKAILSPESHTVGDMTRLARAVLRSGVSHLQLFFHSSSLLPGLTPFTQTSGDVERLYDRVEELLDRLHRWYEWEYASVTEVAKLSVPEAASMDVEPRESFGAVFSESNIRGSFGQERRALLRRFHLSRTGARMVDMARSAYWRLGGYRRMQHVRWSDVKRLVFVCSGNICRSPYAEHLARGQSLQAVSLGIDTKLDGVADPVARRVADQRGVRLEEHRTTPLGRFRPREGDLFIAMEPFQAALIVKQGWPVPHQVTLLGLWAGANGPVIPDPYGRGEEQFNHCFSVIERGVARIERRLEVEALSERQPRATPSSHAAS